ncbi:tRNA pseudouridine(55) synthase TruB [Aureibacillus halotolerans]|uniref:tRNA pseudouridine synthase B n=1 Tax=Aureibacillus halotolerans TaxID=1508390 RepID=A0A4R6U535_9BACI|nr:tRNA pseudouridine(55) synthase TruB [Aureibacillus halotolerans]TDQ39689.1 tRNA pseudouridine synthase B [Aureibacillus halotolerans]
MDGVLPLLKPAGMTSRQCVSKVQRLLGVKKAGHTGTLDPEVTGVLPICLGKGTKLVEYLTGHNKTYEAEITLGFSTSTEDAEGDIIEEVAIHPEEVNEKNIMLTLESFQGTIIQTPPMYSAVKVNGKRLYEYAREGITVERPSREVSIYDIALLSAPVTNDGRCTFSVRVECSKGTYIRTLAVDIGKKLAYPAHMSTLVRSSSGPFTLQDCTTFDSIEAGTYTIMSIKDALADLPFWQATEAVTPSIKNGAVLLAEQLPSFTDKLCIETPDSSVIAVYIHHPEKPGMVKPDKMIVLTND